ncbi:hypothetical protein H113_03302 [Trichophyton rubrum MR1459]|uniref:Protein kinase domain-containing protein n=1 Tax=Trichophyton rubrum (strain ATCC MYA-4607 / CBS 118892) TaxID=559305 RepID=F2SS45_TRIRC|nr:uncharacterized protein TERG_05893 [Trichophyton rubrum CBS 118892]EGD89656.2 hypothetical protein TERG_05893 [Trichophyton rubrum CBS 118892]EZF96548.1 hypothetical protein H113_03302 [Trichophyton rubrum MR1459]EZG07544.1 hypothetical protein H106_03134 [Trichophyton rubrum CBS 735.88]
MQCYPHRSVSVIDTTEGNELLMLFIDLKVENILVSFEEPSVLEDFAQLQAQNPMPRKSNNGNTVYLSHNDFGPVRSYYILPKITDFGLSHHQKDPSLLNRHPIQPDQYRAPEVILGAGWTYSADIWNLGLLVVTSFFYHLSENT